ncbi:MAG: bifunctional 3-(3-hydroxy-phenyl)propionate/3-hydroxycinnamic acid hydroxylase [Phenylobacterium sp.]|uniref:bifunctional 3-(3-hydroxy-phenyl)propionate/3-hydroxycinnamic acid hydroxylase MhpA n=1 Tax=Phenylobacterium sp. TaxID=1871053 RepID=UPI0025F23CEF|nr:bifunctional 3-(3-hydroxy-phenyl)propionate/3-hydroxycinnamic acid hydroxylase [Phenylobacterium sp.]MBI1197031.1 bifunctional 3-(3-hydroxy-phenyl)propionate/3-hydroxycinnamic acid hydroxylase [Phenylobacterium sp.]
MAADCDVLIVGMGPVGAALAALLGDLGVRTLVVERDREVYPLPRAAHFDHEAMRLFQQLGIAEDVLAHARPVPDYEFRAADGQLLMRFDAPAGRPGAGWRSGYMFHQPGLENALRAKVAAQLGVEVRLGARLLSLSDDGAGVSARIEDAGGERTVRARYLVGCDGGSSVVRTALGVGLFDYGFDEPWLVIDAKVGDGARTPEVNLQICDPERPTTCVLMGPGRHRWEFMLKPGETAEQVLADDFIQPLIATWDCGPVELERRAVYRFHGLVAKAWRVGRVLLAGDAAHQMPPFAGQGMCSGLRDAANLAWKLAAVLKGADAALLDTYQTEREPHVRAYIELAIGMGRTVCTLDPQVAAQRDAAMLARGPKAAGMASPRLGPGLLMEGDGAGVLAPQPWADGVGLDDALGPGAWLIARGAVPEAPDVTAVSIDAPRLAPYREALAAWLDAKGAPAVLVRPDRYVFGVGEPAAWRAPLRAAVSA